MEKRWKKWIFKSSILYKWFGAEGEDPVFDSVFEVFLRPVFGPSGLLSLIWSPCSLFAL